jgi:hypothetical protein
MVLRGSDSLTSRVVTAIRAARQGKDHDMTWNWSWAWWNNANTSPAAATEQADGEDEQAEDSAE